MICSLPISNISILYFPKKLLLMVNIQAGSKARVLVQRRKPEWFLSPFPISIIRRAIHFETQFHKAATSLSQLSYAHCTNRSERKFLPAPGGHLQEDQNLNADSYHIPMSTENLYGPFLSTALKQGLASTHLQKLKSCRQIEKCPFVGVGAAWHQGLWLHQQSPWNSYKKGLVWN